MKIFGVGFQRTGITSLTQALNVLGIHSIQFPQTLYNDIQDAVIHQFDGFTDNPIPLIYQQLDQMYPNSKFIHTIRAEESWLKSVAWLFQVGSHKFQWAQNPFIAQFHMDLYGQTTFDAKIFLARYRKHNQEVATYFANRPQDYILLNIEQGEGFEKVCPFLGKPIDLKVLFPHRNQTEGIWKIRVRQFFKQIRDRNLG